jgi:hypothetical protein
MNRTHKPPPVVQEQLIAALLPNVHVEPPPPSPAPLPTLPTAPLPTSSIDGLLVGMARIDHSGRLHERRLFHALSWMSGQQLALDVVHGLIVVRPAPTGPHVLDHRGALHLPAATRHMCGINPGLPVVLAASVPEQTVVIHPEKVVTRLLATHYADLLGGRHER